MRPLLTTNMVKERVPLRKSVNPQIKKIPQQSKVLAELKMREQNVKDVQRFMEQPNQESSSIASDQDSKNDKKTWKIVIGVGLGIGLVTAVGYYALKE